MATLKTTIDANWAHTDNVTAQEITLWQRYLAYADKQAGNRTLWFFITLLVHGVLILALPAVLIYYYNAPVWILGITMTCFFANLIANMGGAGIRTTLSFFYASVLIHLIMIVLVLAF